MLAPLAGRIYDHAQQQHASSSRGQQVRMIDIREFAPGDHSGVMDLWRASPGVVMRDVDGLGPITTYLKKNAGMSFVAVAGDMIVGAVLCGTDGRRGYLHHLAVHSNYRRQGIGRRLVDSSLRALTRAGIDKCHLMVLVDNHEAMDFWTRIGWRMRSDVQLMSHTASDAATA